MFYYKQISAGQWKSDLKYKKIWEVAGGLNNFPQKTPAINVQQIFREELQTRRPEACWRASPILASRAVYGNAEFNKLFSTPCHWRACVCVCVCVCTCISNALLNKSIMTEWSDLSAHCLHSLNTTELFAFHLSCVTPHDCTLTEKKVQKLSLGRHPFKRYQYVPCKYVHFKH